MKSYSLQILLDFLFFFFNTMVVKGRKETVTASFYAGCVLHHASSTPSMQETSDLQEQLS